MPNSFIINTFKAMPKVTSILLVIVFACFPVSGQGKLLNRPELLDLAGKGLKSMYNYNFRQADSLIAEINKELPSHPVTEFMKALVIYWENSPLLIGNTKSDQFLAHLEESIHRSRLITDKEPRDIEGVFFELVSEAVIMMFYADNGKQSKVIPYLAPSYRMLKIGFDLDDVFVEFCFTTGLYNYYIEMYPKQHPAYKPIAALFPRGDKTLGLNLIKKVAQESVFLKNEALVYLNHLYLSYENNPVEALKYVMVLHHDFPRNPGYLVSLVNTLVAAGQYGEAEPLVQELFQRGEQNAYIRMAAYLYYAILLERKYQDFEKAKSYYVRVLKFSDDFGSYVDVETAMAYLGLSRIAEHQGDMRKSREYARQGRALCSYEYLYQVR
jgi:hypothetical protein